MPAFALEAPPFCSFESKPAIIAIPQAQQDSAMSKSARRPKKSEHRVPVRAATKEVTELTKLSLDVSAPEPSVHMAQSGRSSLHSLTIRAGDARLQEQDR